MKTSNIEHRTSNIEHPMAASRRWALSVGCWMLGVSLCSAQTLSVLPQALVSAGPAPFDGAKGKVTLAWTASPSPDVVAYRIAFGTNATALNNSTQVGRVTNVTIKGLTECVTYYFAATAVNSNGVESAFSNTTNQFIQPKIELTPAAWTGAVRLIARTNIIQASTNLVTWVNILTNTTGGVVTWLRTNAVREYYRVKP